MSACTGRSASIRPGSCCSSLPRMRRSPCRRSTSNSKPSRWPAMPGETLATGWDLGGAHLKAVQSDAGGHLQAALQLPCTLWRGLDHLARAIAEARQQLTPTRRHGITMTGELADLFLRRAEGVERLTAAMRAAFPDAELRIYAGEAGFIAPSDVARHVRDVASANWHASASFVAARLPGGLFVDIGSTTTDIIPFSEGRCRAV